MGRQEKHKNFWFGNLGGEKKNSIDDQEGGGKVTLK